MRDISDFVAEGNQKTCSKLGGLLIGDGDVKEDEYAQFLILEEDLRAQCEIMALMLDPEFRRKFIEGCDDIYDKLFQSRWGRKAVIKMGSNDRWKDIVPLIARLADTDHLLAIDLCKRAAYYQCEHDPDAHSDEDTDCVEDRAIENVRSLFQFIREDKTLLSLCIVCPLSIMIPDERCVSQIVGRMRHLLSVLKPRFLLWKLAPQVMNKKRFYDATIMFKTIRVYVISYTLAYASMCPHCPVALVDQFVVGKICQDIAACPE